MHMLMYWRRQWGLEVSVVMFQAILSSTSQAAWPTGLSFCARSWRVGPGPRCATSSVSMVPRQRGEIVLQRTFFKVWRHFGLYQLVGWLLASSQGQGSCYMKHRTNPPTNNYPATDVSSGQVETHWPICNLSFSSDKSTMTIW